MINYLKKYIGYYKDLNLFVKASIWFIIVTLIDKGVSIITQPIINRILTVDEVGIFGAYNSWRSIFSVLATFNLFGGVLEVHLTKEPDKKNTFVASFCSLSILISVIFWSVFFGFGDLFTSLMGLKKIYLIIMAFAIISEVIIQFWAVPKRFEYSYKIYSIVITTLFVSKSVLSVLLSLFFTSDRILGRILGLAIPAILLAIILLFFIFRKISFRNITKYWKTGIMFNFPLIPHYLSSILLASSDRVMIQQIDSDNSAGLYTVVYSYSNLVLIIFNALNNSYNPLSMKCIKDKDYNKLSSTTEMIVVLSVLFSIFMMLLAPEGIFILGGENYLVSIDIVPILIIGIFFSSFYFIFSNIEFVYEKNKYIFPITLFGAILNLILNYCLIPVYGYKVAAYTTLLGYLCISILHYFVSRSIVKKDIYNTKKLLLYIGVLVVGGIISCVLYILPFFIRYISVIVLLVVSIIYITKNKNKLIRK